MIANKVTLNQYDALLKLGYCGRKMQPCSVDETIDFLRKKFHIIIYNKAAPFVDPVTNSFIYYGFKVKFCNVGRGWNFRENLGESKWSRNIYAAKRMAITIAIKHAFKIKNRRAKVINLCRATATGRSKSLTKKLEK